MDIRDIIIFALVAILFLIIGLCLGAVTVFNLQDSVDQEPGEDRYCFECEIEMPVKEKNGRLYCSNCGLPH